jgi:glycosyltransferase involved in cell wall biosynthesis
MNRLKALGAVENVALFPHGITDLTSGAGRIANRTPRVENLFTVATYGFFLPHKGLLETIEAVALLRRRGLEVRLKMLNAEYPLAESEELIRQARETVARLDLVGHVSLNTAFLDDRDCLSQLAEADLLVFAYQQTGESASGAVRYGIATGIPVAVTPLPIFEDVAPAVFMLPGSTPPDLADGLEVLLRSISSDSGVLRVRREAADRWREAHRYSRLSRRLFRLLAALRCNSLDVVARSSQHFFGSPVFGESSGEQISD